MELITSVSVHPTPSRTSSVDSQCSTTSNHSHHTPQRSQTSPEPMQLPAYENLNMDHIARLTSEGKFLC